jgi:Zn finger protein HypA/HybF involved in hydrogenase expression
MHESHMTEEMLEVALAKASEAGIAKITRICLAIGDKSHVTPESVKMYFDIFSKGNAAEGAELSFRSMEGDEDFYIESVEGD